MVVFPLMVPGIAGMEFDDTANVCTEEEPQVLFAFTVIFPLVVVVVAVIELVVELPVHPEGSVHVYDVAPLTAATL